MLAFEKLVELHDVHHPLETDDDLATFFTWRELRRVSKSLTMQYDKVLYLIGENKLNRKAIGKYIEVGHYQDGLFSDLTGMLSS